MSSLVPALSGDETENLALSTDLQDRAVRSLLYPTRSLYEAKRAWEDSIREILTGLIVSAVADDDTTPSGLWEFPVEDVITWAYAPDGCLSEDDEGHPRAEDIEHMLRAFDEWETDFKIFRRLSKHAISDLERLKSDRLTQLAPDAKGKGKASAVTSEPSQAWVTDDRPVADLPQGIPGLIHILLAKHASPESSPEPSEAGSEARAAHEDPEDDAMAQYWAYIAKHPEEASGASKLPEEDMLLQYLRKP